MIKNKISIIVSNLKPSIASFKIYLGIIKRFSILIIDNKYIRNAFILQFLLKVSTCNISISHHFFY